MTSLHNQRIFYGDNGTISDFSVALNDFRSGTESMTFVAAEDYLYIGSYMPFNHKYIKLGSTVNGNTSALSIDIWFSNDWQPAKDIIDQTSSSGVSLAQDGIIRWTTDRLEGWERELDSDDITGLEAASTAPIVYNMFWMRMKWSADLTASTTLSYIGHKFSNDDELYSYYPDLNQTPLKTAFETGKTDWEEQAFIAADLIIRDLKRRNIIKSQDQLLNYDQFLEPSVHKVAEIIYGGLGKPYFEDRAQSLERYNKAMDLKFFNIDHNQDARLSDVERHHRTGFATR